VTEIVAIARRIAAAAPDAELPCPVCGALLRAGNLERHLARIHPGDRGAGTAWRGRGWKGGRLSWDDGVLRWRSRTGLRRRSVGPEQVVVAGSTVSNRTEWTSVTNFPDHGGTTTQERSGAYVEVHGDGRPIAVHCRAGGTVRKAWVGWEAGPRLTQWQITVDPDAFVALSYLLVAAGALRPRPTGT
jgi:hypothetical protein